MYAKCKLPCASKFKPALAQTTIFISEGPKFGKELLLVLNPCGSGFPTISPDFAMSLTICAWLPLAPACAHDMRMLATIIQSPIR